MIITSLAKVGKADNSVLLCFRHKHFIEINGETLFKLFSPIFNRHFIKKGLRDNANKRFSPRLNLNSANG